MTPSEFKGRRCAQSSDHEGWGRTKPLFRQRLRAIFMSIKGFSNETRSLELA